MSAEGDAAYAQGYEAAMSLAVARITELEKANEAVHRWLLSVKKLDPEVNGLDAVILLTAALKRKGGE